MRRHLAKGDVGLALLLALGGAQAALWLLDLPVQEPRSTFAWRAMGLWSLQLASAFVAWQRRDRRVLLVVLLFALIFRVAAWTWPPALSDDLYRYIWDGREGDGALLVAEVGNRTIRRVDLGTGRGGI